MTLIERPEVFTFRRMALRLVLGLQMFFWVGYLLVAALLVIAAAKFGGFDFYPFGDGDMRDPKDVLGLGIAGLVLHLPLALVAVYGTWPGAIAGLAGCVALAAVWRTDSPLKWKLVGSTAMTVAFVLVQVSPLGALIRQWMLD